ncbi:membrane protein [Aliiruegeria haliotis]|uniref:Membrane protein n=1 Tax=Aliiruegeria haliotis TaxID=1280846 RepID=A0A2T0RF81_9RHOB|nr:YihY/virulence factor BrkB family protein [Aliiruegeria haliotis]PRY19781.1 membrane protein [Aliiruegeria haliotis]
MRPLRTILTALWQAWLRFDTDNGWAKASHVAMSMMLALFPFCIFTLSLAGQFSSELRIDDLIEFVYGAWPDQVAEPISREVRAVLAQSGTGKTAFGAILAIFFASNGVDAVRSVVTDAFQDKDPRPVCRQRALCVIFVVAGAFLMAIVGGVVIGLPAYAGEPSVGAEGSRFGFLLGETLHNAVTMALLLLTVFACHAWLQGVHHPAREVLPGLLLTLVLWIFAGYGFSLCFSHFSSYSLTYAGLAGIMAALVFLYLMAAIFVLCAEFNGRLRAIALAPGNRVV